MTNPLISLGSTMTAAQFQAEHGGLRRDSETGISITKAGIEYRWVENGNRFIGWYSVADFHGWGTAPRYRNRQYPPDSKPPRNAA